MRNIQLFWRVFLLSILVMIASQQTFAQSSSETSMPPKVKTFLTIAAYGTAGGALLGLASLAFGTNGRAIAQGASLGLYAGILFGGYVLVSHSQRKAQYYDNSSPYNNNSNEYEDYEKGGEGSGEKGFFDSHYQREQMKSEKVTQLALKNTSSLPALFVPVLHFSF
jgi:hypothetical protein